MNKNKAVFLDRDGVINEDFGYVYKIDKFVFKDGIFETLRYFQEKGYLLIIITNQSGINRGYFSEKDFLALDNFMKQEFKKQSIEISKTYFCPHHPDELCKCRKPKPKMINDAQKDFNIDLKSSILIGDKITDIKAGQNAGIKKLFLIGDISSNKYIKIKNIYESTKNNI